MAQVNASLPVTLIHESLLPRHSISQDDSASLNSVLLGTTSTFFAAYGSVSDIVPTLHNNFILTSTTVLAQPASLNGSATSFPQKLIVVPSLNGHPSPSWHPRVCVLVLCQGMSIATGSNDSLHVPDPKGYTIKCPRTFEHRHRDGVRYFTTLLEYAVTLVEIAAGFVTKVPRRLRDRAMSGVSSIRGVADNMDQLDMAGIAPDAMFSVQDVTDRHQRDAIKKLLLGADRHGKDNITGDLECIVLQDKRRFWVCRQCSECLQNGDHIDGRSYMMLPQYVSLVKREPKNEVTLNDADSVILLTKSLSKSHETNELIIHLNSTYFEAIERAEGAPFKAIMHMFKKLGKVLKKQKNLTLLEIHGNSTNGKTWIGLRAALKCRALKRLRVTGIPCFFQDKNIPMKCRNLEELSLQDVHLNTDQAAGNLWMLIGMNPCLSRLKMTRTMITATILSKVKPMVTLMQFSRIESLDLSNSDIGEQEVIHFVKMALASDNPRLKRLHLSGNRGIGGGTCESVLKLLANKKCWLKEFEMKDTGVDMRTLESYVSKANRTGFVGRHRVPWHGYDNQLRAHDMGDEESG
ncbi:hypothetical protein B0O80DRAFT_495038 [Mortierella sp. GBAus27b]|nr:hypothetical protein B0O80DRAFT_495038 [Mortierella sp. GBAus27b]